MADESIILAHCSKTGKKFCIEVKKKGSGYQAVNFVDLSDGNYISLVSELSCESLTSADNLLPCRYCQSRKVSGCSCNRKRKRCGKGDKYDFQCLYCDFLQMDQPESMRQKIYVTSKHYDDIGEVLRSINLDFEPFVGTTATFYLSTAAHRIILIPGNWRLLSIGADAFMHLTWQAAIFRRLFLGRSHLVILEAAAKYSPMSLIRSSCRLQADK